MTFRDLVDALLTSDTSSVGALQFILALTVPFVLGIVIAKTYQTAQDSHQYSVGFVHSLILFCVLTSVITLVIGGNIARAFGLVATFSLIRFRTAIKETIDVIYLFWALTVGITCGAGHFFGALAICLVCAIYLTLLSRTAHGRQTVESSVLKVVVEATGEEEIVRGVEGVLADADVKYERINVLFDSDVDERTYVFGLRHDVKVKGEELRSKLKAVKGVKEIHHANHESALFV